MTRGEYLRYWAKGEDGKFLPSVVEPAEGRRAWIQKKQAEMAAQPAKSKEKIKILRMDNIINAIALT